jgi:hypothetical protein
MPVSSDPIAHIRSELDALAVHWPITFEDWQRVLELIRALADWLDAPADA